MANILNKDPFTYTEERRTFLQNLQRFHTSRGTSYDRVPEIGGREVDLYHLYRRVTDQGGWQKAKNGLFWEDIQEEFGLPESCANAAQALKYIYFRYLNSYEKVHYLGLDLEHDGNDQENGPARKKICLPIESVPLTYNYSQHKILDNQREANHLSTNLARFSDYEKLEMSLRSGLANEVDFAVNICLLLSNEGEHVLKLSKSVHLLPLLMANVGIFDDGPGTMEDVMTHSWTDGDSKRDYLRFWYEVVGNEEVRKIIRTKHGIYKREGVVGSEVLHLGRDLGFGDAEGHRVTQLATLIRNLSFEEINQQPLASSSLVLRFLMLCVHSSYGSLRQLAMDALGNLAAQMVLQAVETTTATMIMNLIKMSLVEEDKFAIVRALEILSKLCQVQKNEGILNDCLEGETYSRMVQLLTVQDIQLIVHTLEALYQLSELGDPATSRLANVRNAVDMLVSLLTVEAQSYGPSSLGGIKVVEFVSPQDASEAAVSSTPQSPHTVIQSVPPDQTADAPTHAPQQSPAVQQVRSDVETTASNWLTATFEAKKNSFITQADAFADYQQFCRKFGVADLLTLSDFASIVKSAMPQSSLAELDKGGGEKELVFAGLRKRSQPKPFVVLAGSDRVSKPSACSVPVSSVRGPGPANFTSAPNTVASPTPAHTSTLRQRLLEPPRMSLQHRLLHHAGVTGAGVRPAFTADNRTQTTVSPKLSPMVVKLHPTPPAPSAAYTSGPGPGTSSPQPPGPVSLSPRPALMANIIHNSQHSMLAVQQQVASASYPGSIQAASGDCAMVQSSVFPLQKPASVAVSSGTTLTALSTASTSSGQQFPLIHQALQGDDSMSGGKTTGDQGNDTNLIKSLLAKKVCQNMVRGHGSITSSQSPPQEDCRPDTPVTPGSEPSFQPQCHTAPEVQPLTAPSNIVQTQQPLQHVQHQLQQHQLQSATVQLPNLQQAVSSSHAQEQQQQIVQAQVVEQPNASQQQQQVFVQKQVQQTHLPSGVPVHLVQSSQPVSGVQVKIHAAAQAAFTGGAQHPQVTQSQQPEGAPLQAGQSHAGQHLQAAHSQSHIILHSQIAESKQPQTVLLPQMTSQHSQVVQFHRVPSQHHQISQHGQVTQTVQQGQVTLPQQVAHTQVQGVQYAQVVQPQQVQGLQLEQVAQPHVEGVQHGQAAQLQQAQGAQLAQAQQPQVVQQVVQPQQVQGTQYLQLAQIRKDQDIQHVQVVQPQQVQGAQQAQSQQFHVKAEQPQQAQSVSQAQVLQPQQDSDSHPAEVAQPQQIQAFQQAHVAYPHQTQGAQHAQIAQAHQAPAVADAQAVQLKQAQGVQHTQVACPQQASDVQNAQAAPTQQSQAVHQQQLVHLQLPGIVQKRIQGQSQLGTQQPTQQQQIVQCGQTQTIQTQAPLQQVLHLQQGQQVVLRQQVRPQQQHIHIQPRISGQQQTLRLQPQQIVLQASPQQQIHIQPHQQIILHQQPQHVVIQGQPALQQILRQQVQHLQIHPAQQLQIQGQGQALRIQTQSQQPMVIQLPVYQLPQMGNTQIAPVSGTSLSSTLVQTTAGGLGQSTLMPYRAIVPQPSASVSDTSSSHTPQASSNGHITAQLAAHTQQSLGLEGAGAAAGSVVAKSKAASTSQIGTIYGQNAGALPSALNTLSRPAEAVNGSGSGASQVLRDTLSGQAVSTISAAPEVQMLPSPGQFVSRPLSTASSSSSLMTHSAAISSAPSSSHSLSAQDMPVLSSPMSITQAILSGQEVHKAGSSHMNTAPSPSESHHRYANGNIGAPASREFNGVGGFSSDSDGPQGRLDIRGMPESPDSASDDLPPSPVEGVKVNIHQPSNGLVQENVSLFKKVAGQCTKDLLSIAERVVKFNGATHQLENGIFSHSKIEMDQAVPPAEKKMFFEAEKKHGMCQVNGLHSLEKTKENSVAHHSAEGNKVFVKQTSIEEVSLDSTDCKLMMNCRKSDDSIGRPLFSPDSSRDSDMSCDSFASSLTDSLSSEKHSSQRAHSLPRSSSVTPSLSPSPCTVLSEVPVVLTGTVSMSEAGKRNKKLAAIPKGEKPLPKCKKRKAENDTAHSGVVYACEWAGCKRCFDSARLVFIHVTKKHVPPLPEAVCRWHGCEPLKRKRWSLVTHIQDHHCSEMAQRAGHQRRLQAAQIAGAQRPPLPAQKAPTIVYPNDAAMQAIKRFHIKPPFHEFSEAKEGPVTKHIRLTSALILRNLARYSSHGRSQVKHREQLLSYAAMSAVESSTALCSCLWEILDST